jgi:hypothetical protein
MSREPVALSAHGAGPADQLWGPAPLPPLEQNTTSLQEAISRGTLGVGYSGSGCVFFPAALVFLHLPSPLCS